MMDLSGKDQKKGNAIVASLTALSGVVTNLLGFVNLVKFLPFFEDNTHALFYIGVIVICICIPSTLFFGTEKRFVKTISYNQNNEEESSIDQLLVLFFFIFFIIINNN